MFFQSACYVSTPTNAFQLLSNVYRTQGFMHIKKSCGTPQVISVSGLCDEQTWSTRKTLLYYLYFPFSIIVVTGRLLSLLIISTLTIPLPSAIKKTTYRLLLRLLGIHIKCALSSTQVGNHTDGCVVALNHISVFDHFPVLAMPHATVMVVKTDSTLGLAAGYMLFKCSGTAFWRPRNLKQLARQLSQWRKSPQGTALYTTPEATINNGKGLFRFRPEFLNKGLPVVPLAIKLRTPFGLNPNPLNDTGAIKFLRLLSMPWLEFDMSFLEKQSPRAEQNPQDFADHIQSLIATHLNIPATHWRTEDKYDFRNGTSSN